MVNLAAPKTFQFIEYVLDQKTFTQYRAAKELHLTMPLINQATNYLLKRGFIAHDGKQYNLRDAAGLIASIHLFRDMKDLQLLEIHTSLEKEKAMASLQATTAAPIYCLDTALNNYSNWWRSNLVCAYVEPQALDEIHMTFLYHPGNATVLRVFKEKPKVEKFFEARGQRFTAKTRTVIDMVCDKQLNAVEPLFRQLWGRDVANP
ncbi:MAG TPA: hypothetical protein HA252_03490 [Candidatus Diapherotrites archaeon]|uniref:Uncharacterized protein n=1 Tax=Candidatus Iainarchaeum sp. TaxID=3101447 RepID=A0A7J4JF88_9ARCH|nr:hypothetical protein [Candidatus Diapherotrites archaeon]HIH16442.1 hypothetical protein [Candidatus Diapherotrites archaeon]